MVAFSPDSSFNAHFSDPPLDGNSADILKIGHRAALVQKLNLIVHNTESDRQEILDDTTDFSPEQAILHLGLFVSQAAAKGLSVVKNHASSHFKEEPQNHSVQRALEEFMKSLPKDVQDELKSMDDR